MTLEHRPEVGRVKCPVVEVKRTVGRKQRRALGVGVQHSVGGIASHVSVHIMASECHRPPEKGMD